MLLKIGELAKRTGLTVRTLHHYDAIGLLAPSARSDAAQALASQWMVKIRRDTGANPVLFAKLNSMHEQEPSMQASTGISPELMGFVIAAAHEGRMAIYRNYLDDEEMAFMRANVGKRNSEWPPLVAQVRTAMDQGRAPDSPEAQALARHWFDLFRSFAGDNPETQKKIRNALENEPGLTDSGFIDAAMREYMKAAIGSLRS